MQERMTVVIIAENFHMDYLTEIEERLKSGAGVVIENEDFEKLIKVYDRPNALFIVIPISHRLKNTMMCHFPKVTTND